MRDEYSGEHGGEVTRTVLDVVRFLEEEDDEYEYAARGKVLIRVCRDHDLDPENAEKAINMQLMKGRIYEPEENRLARI